MANHSVKLGQRDPGGTTNFELFVPRFTARTIFGGPDVRAPSTFLYKKVGNRGVGGIVDMVFLKCMCVYVCAYISTLACVEDTPHKVDTLR